MRDYTRFLGSLERPDTTSDKFSLFYLWLWSKTAHNLQTLWSGLGCKKALMTLVSESHLCPWPCEMTQSNTAFIIHPEVTSEILYLSHVLQGKMVGRVWRLGNEQSGKGRELTGWNPNAPLLAEWQESYECHIIIYFLLCNVTL